MTKEFVPYEQALALKELGFDEPCLGMYYPNPDSKDQEITFSCDNGIVDDIIGIKDKTFIKAPLYQQAFRWFREKHGLQGSVFPVEVIKNKVTYQFNIYLDENLRKGEFLSITDTEPADFDHEKKSIRYISKLIEILKKRS